VVHVGDGHRERLGADRVVCRRPKRPTAHPEEHTDGPGVVVGHYHVRLPVGVEVCGGKPHAQRRTRKRRGLERAVAVSQEDVDLAVIDVGDGKVELSIAVEVRCEYERRLAPAAKSVLDPKAAPYS